MSPNTEKKISFYTLGCRVNQYESEALAELALKKGYTVVPFGEKCEICVVNTCAVTAESSRKSAQIIRRASKTADAVYVAGCYSELEPQKVKSITSVKKLVGCNGKSKLFDGLEASFTDKGFELLSIANVPSKTVGFSSNCRAYIKIQDGCNGRCSYCIIPSLRGPSRSRPVEEVYAEAKRLVLNGFKEITLTGIETAAYNGAPLSELISKIASLSGLERVRLGSLDPNCLNDRFIETLKNEKKMMPHLHLSLQSGCTRILNLMNRPYTAKEAEEKIKKLKNAVPKVMLSADIISSFPTETEQEFEETADFLNRIGFLHIHAFSYSPRPGTPAAVMDGQVDEQEKKRRNAELIALAARMKKELLSKKIGTECKVLIESKKGSYYLGHSEDYAEIAVSSQEPLSEGKIIKVTVSKTDGALLYAEA